jgi:hypothetical protein
MHIDPNELIADAPLRDVRRIFRLVKGFTFCPEWVCALAKLDPGAGAELLRELIHRGWVRRCGNLAATHPDDDLYELTAVGTAIADARLGKRLKKTTRTVSHVQIASGSDLRGPVDAEGC